MTESFSDDYRRILVIDDNESIHGDFYKILSASHSSCELDALDAELFGDPLTDHCESSLDFELTFATQGRTGFELLKANNAQGGIFGAAFVDMRMPPGWDGIETIEHLWQVDPDLQIVICTAFADHSWEDINHRLGQTDKLLILKKPFDEIEVVQLATSLCEKRRLLELSKRRMDDLQETVRKQAGRIEFEVEEGVGTTFLIQLPLEPEESKNSESESDLRAEDAHRAPSPEQEILA